MENHSFGLPLYRGSYKYEDIPAGNTVRILSLWPGKPGNRLKGRLEFSDLADKPEYEAISYVWGDPTQCDEILIDGESLGLTQSISDALRRMRHHDVDRKLWADQVCIDQKNLNERGHQVKLMGQIYKNTTRVLVWLGRDGQNLARPVFEKFTALKELYEDEGRLKQFTEDQREHPESFDDGSWEPLRIFYKLPWFVRVWIEQEAGTGAPMQLFWGDEKYDWGLVFSVSYTLDTYHKPLRDYFHLQPQRVGILNRSFVAYESNHRDEVFHPRRSFVYKLHRSRTKEATDPRDRIFSNLGHFTASILLETTPAFEANYMRSIVELYIDVANKLLQGYTTLELLNTVQHCDVSDWGNGSKRGILGFRNVWFRTSEVTTPSLTLDKSGTVLSIKGVEIDTADVLSEELNQQNFPYSEVQTGQVEEGVVLRLWRVLCQSPSVQLKDDYVSGESAFPAFCQGLTAGCFSKVRENDVLRKSYHSVSPNSWLRHGAAYLTRVFAETGLVHNDVQKAGEGEDAFAWSHGAKVVCHRRPFFRTTREYYGLGPSEIERNDLIVVLFGGTTPYVLRPTAGRCAFVGECHVVRP